MMFVYRSGVYQPDHPRVLRSAGQLQVAQSGTSASEGKKGTAC